uniref:tetratricopeptide repeat protein n=1 Tax=uncultured Erythrobacter sp. TaxID=263913 RepID=UPI002604E63C|nr:tetratricopeptide repeat protein [uncultured Erythrobacter sp.]
MTFTAFAIALAVSNPVADSAVEQSEASAQRTELSSEALARGESESAILKLEKQVEESPNDPALLINLGIAYAQSGDDAKARLMFKAAMSSSEEFDLETADGSEMDSRRLARKAMSMLDRGEFRQPSSRMVMAE